MPAGSTSVDRMAGLQPGHPSRRVYARFVDASRFHQVVPRPEGAQRGARPSWSGRSDRAALRLDAAALRASLADPAVVLADPVRVSSAVLVGLLPGGGDPRVVLTRRAATMRSEPGTISFPGGRLEPGEDPVAGALREAEEEIGLSPGEVRVLGALDPVYRRRDGASVLPVVGVVAEAFEPRPNPDEVEAVLLVRLSALLEEGAAWTERWGIAEEAREVAFFAHPAELGRNLVWGMTARMLWQVLERLAGA